MKTTNYINTFIRISEDCPVRTAEIPPLGGVSKTIARRQYEWLSKRPYQFTSDTLLFGIHAERHHLPGDDIEEEQKKFFSKGQPCLRTSPLAKRYGWGFHHDERGRVALIPYGSDEYTRFAGDENLTQLTALRSRR